MNMPRLPQIRICAGLFAIACLVPAAGAQTVYRHVDEAGHITYTDRREAPITGRWLAPLPGQTRPAPEMQGRAPEISAALSQAVDRREARRRLAQAKHERARGPDMQQGIPPIAERHPGERRRERVAALEQMVESAQARVRELDSPAAVSQVAPPAMERQALATAQQ